MSHRLERFETLCEHAFVGEHRSTHAVFQHAIERRNLLTAEAAAWELGRLSLAHALDFLLQLSEKDPARFRSSAVSRHARFVLEARGLRLATRNCSSAQSLVYERQRR